MSTKRYILTREEAAQKLLRMSIQLAENLTDSDAPVILMGVKMNGLVLAEKVCEILKSYIPQSIQIIAVELDKLNPMHVSISETISFDGKNIVLIDDVANSGRTMLYALKPLLEASPRSIQTMVLVERMHKLFPVNPDYVGLSLATTQADHIQVEVENGQVMGAFVC